jgi:membrane-bound lytic murein transglycosylase MltF
MARTGLCVMLASAGFTVLLGARVTAQPPPPSAPQLPVLERKSTGDLDEMLKRRVIRVLVIPSRTAYFVDKADQRGTTYDAMKAFEQEFNKKQKGAKLKAHIVFIPVGQDEALRALLEGRGDLIAAPIIVTPERQEQVSFTVPVWKDVSEVVVTAPGAPAVKAPEDLSGRTVLVNSNTVYYQHLSALNDRLKAAGKPLADLLKVPESLADEDLLEMVNAGVAEATVTRGYLADFWKQVYTGLVIAPAPLATGEALAWAVRKDSPKFKAELDEFIARNGQGTAFGNEMFRRYLKSLKYVKNSTSPEEMKKFARTVGFFKKYGDQYGMDYLLLMAQGYQESRLDQSQRNPSGALGIMQVLPSTGKAMGVDDITQEENNIHAGVKFLDFMINQYFKDAPMDKLNKGLFAFASYNAGPGRVSGLRREAEKRGLNPNVWFNNVEVVAAERVGQELVGYVSSIFKYYVAYTLVQQQTEARERAKGQAGGAKGK